MCAKAEKCTPPRNTYTKFVLNGAESRGPVYTTVETPGSETRRAGTSPQDTPEGRGLIITSSGAAS